MHSDPSSPIVADHGVTKLISVITPSFQQLGWLQLAAASVSDQEGVEVEHIVQDAGTGPELESWAQEQPRLKLHVEKDAGMYDAINRGLAKACGDICAYLNCDEQYLPGALAKVASFFAAHSDVDVLFGDVVLINSEGRPLSYRRTILPTRRHVRLSHLNTTTCGTFFRRRLFAKGFRFDPQWKAIGDAVWVGELLRNKVPMATLREPLAVFAFTGRNLGETTISKSETLRWRGSPRFPMLQSAGVVLWHRIRKATAGAYRYRHVEIDIYTADSPKKRRRIVGRHTGFGWPRTEST